MTTHLSELQEVTGTTGTDEATFVTVSLAEGADRDEVEDELQRAYPEYTVRTNDEQMRSILQHNTIVIAVGGALVLLAVVAGFALMIDVLSIVVFQQSRELAALTALGVSSQTLVGMITAQGMLIGAAGGLLGVAATPPFAVALNHLAERFVGFENLVQTSTAVLLLGGTIALVIGTSQRL